MQWRERRERGFGRALADQCMEEVIIRLLPFVLKAIIVTAPALIVAVLAVLIIVGMLVFF